MCYSEIEIFAKQCWLEIPEHFQFVILGEWVIMPNHVHGIIFFERIGAHNAPNIETQEKETKDIASLQIYPFFDIISIINETFNHHSLLQ